MILINRFNPEINHILKILLIILHVRISIPFWNTLTYDSFFFKIRNNQIYFKFLGCRNIRYLKKRQYPCWYLTTKTDSLDWNEKYTNDCICRKQIYAHEIAINCSNEISAISISVRLVNVQMCSYTNRAFWSDRY